MNQDQNRPESRRGNCQQDDPCLCRFWNRRNSAVRRFRSELDEVDWEMIDIMCPAKKRQSPG